jgi:hypothetical protein
MSSPALLHLLARWAKRKCGAAGSEPVNASGSEAAAGARRAVCRFDRRRAAPGRTPEWKSRLWARCRLRGEVRPQTCSRPGTGTGVRASQVTGGMLMTVKPFRVAPDRFEQEGWRGQFARVERWQHRALRAVGSGEQRPEDYVYALCQNAYHLRDWLQNSGAASQRDLDELMARTPALKLCRDSATVQSTSSSPRDAPRPTTSGSCASTFHRPRSTESPVRDSGFSPSRNKTERELLRD